MKRNFRNRTLLKKALAIALILLVCLSCFCSCEEATQRNVRTAKVNEKGELVLFYSDGSQENLGKVSAETDALPDDTQKPPSATVASATAMALRSAVRISCQFTAKGYFNETYKSGGSGVIYRLNKSEGSAYIITNYHVVFDLNCNTQNRVSDKISVYLYGSENESQAIPAEYVGGSLYYDIAILKIEKSEILQQSDAAAVTVADSNRAYVGDAAIAIGNPEGYGLAATAGIISVDSEYIGMLAVDERTEVVFRVMRIDTAVNSGNSGGGLFDDEGRLIGIVNAKVIDASVENIGYAIPSNLAIAVADNILHYCEGTDKETPYRALIGISVITSNAYAKYDEKKQCTVLSETVLVNTVSTGAPAEGILQGGDIIRSVTVNEKTVTVTRQHHLIDFMLTVRAGDTVTFSIVRNGSAMEKSITLTQSSLQAY